MFKLISKVETKFKIKSSLGKNHLLIEFKEKEYSFERKTFLTTLYQEIKI